MLCVTIYSLHSWIGNRRVSGRLIRVKNVTERIRECSEIVQLHLPSHAAVMATYCMPVSNKETFSAMKQAASQATVVLVTW